MTSNIRRRVFGPLAATLATTLPLLLATALPAAASVPSNDDISNATVIASLPFHDIADISQATFDPSTDQSFCFGGDHTVWYTFTPASDERVAVDPSNSITNVALSVDVFTGSPGALSFVGCGTGGAGHGPGFILNATGGVTYWIMASAPSSGTVTNLDLWVYLAVAPQATFSVTGGRRDPAGNVTVSGTLDCSGTVPNGVSVGGTVSQPVGRLNSVTANFATRITCAHGLTWTALAQPATGRFVGGPATINAFVSACNLAGCGGGNITAVVRLKG